MSINKYLNISLFAEFLLLTTVYFLPSTVFAASPTTGLVGYWNFDEQTGTTASDSSGSGNNGTLVNGPTWTAGKVGSGGVIRKLSGVR